MDSFDGSAASPATATLNASDGTEGSGRQRSSAGDSLTLSKEGLAALLKSQAPGAARSGKE
ncbi:MAG: hypothetical protein H0X38_09110 [Planctomycetes bacterium]|nr:hypothetical protein [Planctomycetota bacterium]